MRANLRNHIQLEGYVGGNSEVKTDNHGSTFTRFTINVDNSRFDKVKQTYVNGPDMWIEIKVNGINHEKVVVFTGDRVIVQGSLGTPRLWVDGKNTTHIIQTVKTFQDGVIVRSRKADRVTNTPVPAPAAPTPAAQPAAPVEPITIVVTGYDPNGLI